MLLLGYPTRIQWHPLYSNCPRLVSTPFHLMKAIVAMANPYSRNYVAHTHVHVVFYTAVIFIKPLL